MTKIPPRNTLLYVHIPTHFKEIIRVARIMKTSGTYMPFIFFITPYEGWERDMNLCHNESIKCITYFNQNIKSIENIKSLKRSFISYKKIKARCRVNIKAFLTRLVNQSKVVFKTTQGILKQCIHPFIKFLIPSFSKRTWSRLLLGIYNVVWNRAPHLLPPISRAANIFYHNIPVILEENQIELVVFPEHNLFYFTQLMVMIGRQYNIPSIIVPFTIANTKEWSESFYNEPSRSLKGNLNKLCAYTFPHWVNNYKNRQLILPVDLVLLHEMFKITPKNPWLLNSGDIDFLASESDAMTNYYVNAGIEKNHLRTIGALYNDELYLSLKHASDKRTKVYKSLKMDLDKPMILCALPPNQCAGREGLIEFSDYHEIVHFFLDELAKYADSYNIIINLHPRIIPSSVKYINDYPIKIFSGDIAEIIPLSTIYVASCSATIRMAIICGIPVLNYDLYQYRYDDYANLEGVLTVFNRSEYSSKLKKLIQDTNFYNGIKAMQVEQSSEWGALDGKAGPNLIEEINKLFNSNNLISG